MSCCTSFRSRFFVAIAPSVLLPHSRAGVLARDPCPHQALSHAHHRVRLLREGQLHVPVADRSVLPSDNLARLSRNVALTKLLLVRGYRLSRLLDRIVDRCRE